jgi:hypothetical protein
VASEFKRVFYIPAWAVKSTCFNGFFSLLFTIDHCSENNSGVLFLEDEGGLRKAILTCRHYEGVGTEEVAKLLAAMLDLEKCLQREVDLTRLDRATETVEVIVYNVPAKIFNYYAEKWEREFKHYFKELQLESPWSPRHTPTPRD